jgi:hypothetical protein
VTAPVATPVRPVLVLFCDDGGLPLLRLLKPGFRHVFVVLPLPRQAGRGEGAGGWISVDPLIDRMELALHPPWPVHQLAGWFRAQGLTVLNLFLPVPAARQHPPLAPPIAPFTCVEAVKRLLGLRAPWVLTPYQLYRHLGGRAPLPPSPSPSPSPFHRRKAMARLVSSTKSAGVSAANPVTVPTAPTPLQPISTATTTASSSDSGDAGLTAGETSLLRRASGRAGTIATGWRGILLPGALAPARKSLLGE